MINSDVRARSLFWEKYEFIIPLALFLIFLAVTLPGISWGAPAIWHPDEVVYIAIKALYEGMDFDASNFNHPHLPIYAMLWLGKILVALGQTDKEVLIGARVLSAALAGLTIVLAYLVPRRMGHSIYVSASSSLLLLSVSEMMHNGHFAHNDTFVTFFSTLTFFFLVKYTTRRNNRGWLYAAFFASGLAVSSKYVAISLAIVPVLLYLWDKRTALLKRTFRVVETLFMGGILTYLGYAVGTPKALTWMAYYFKRLVPALIYNSDYGYEPGHVRGIVGQYSVFMNGLGVPLFLLFAAAFLWGGYKVWRAYRAKSLSAERHRGLLLLSIFVVDLPIMASYNYPIRFFLPLMPLFAVLGALFINDLYALAKQSGNSLHPKLIEACLTLIVLVSLARSISVMLLFLNDSRIPATAFVASLPAGTSLEHTDYPPTIPEGYFEREHNYPLFFQKAPGEQPPTDKSYVFNTGEAGLDERGTDYLVVDSFTADRFNDPYICKSVQVECDFFKQLATGRSSHYQLMAKFSYTLPRFLPQMNIDFVNPSIYIYERVQ